MKLFAVVVELTVVDWNEFAIDTTLVDELDIDVLSSGKMAADVDVETIGVSVELSAVSFVELEVVDCFSVGEVKYVTGNVISLSGLLLDL